MSLLLAFIFALSGLSTQAMNASLEAPTYTHEALLAPRIEAPAQATLKPTEVEVTTTPAPVTQAPTQAPICEEDMPCWDCTTMGNKVCGPQTTPHAPVQRCEEDMDCWDCTTMGNMICGPVQPAEVTVQPTAEDSAWLSLESATGSRMSADGLALNYVDTYTSAIAPTDLPATQFPVQDTETFDQWHIFEYVPTTDA